MIISESANLHRLVIHKTGNKGKEEGIKFSKSPVQLNETIRDLLIRYFLSPFKQQEYFNFYHDADLSLNEVFHFSAAIFDDPGSFYLNSVNLANHLYECSSHPKVKPGELYISYFQNLELDGQALDAIGIFKSESKETFLKVYPDGDNFTIEHEDGININKLDKGCLIFNSERENGFVVASVDNLSKGNDALYWMDDFLKVRQRNDQFFQTSQTLALCRNFVTEKLPETFEIDRPGQAELLNKSMKFFRENDNFVMEEFVSEVFEQPEVIQTFNEYRRDFEVERDMRINDDFDISGQAVRKQARVYKSVIKLDKNFHIYIHGNRNNIEKGYDEERGMDYYRLFFKEES
ncbi:nucleoid-associated protein [Lentimicrobium sp.]|uniref:nucleoid-associated protein n=1 Tax=Lentimicrobium sp. TaxID=2034841 RepID=UPI0025D8D527|nr:nucleoid-associated protein [Lentimicrobium sp.]MCO5255387.1 nucleoid-associated protein [Lentimicrobium sp.]MCO5261406.1 nucleoid-associated protein [Lentimicrobium sp.]HOP13557.1 nucleoid-associated protein [Lentimicrobium sp.]HPF63272.1 nucleoid-associated protein [Lentimicrobium sp.]HPJ61689.1 nucleoid-associated protein [Lentimicrobium sp.]